MNLRRGVQAQYRKAAISVEEPHGQRASSHVDAFAVARQQSWARWLQRVFEIEPLTCPTCGERMQIVGFITQPAGIDKILRHRREKMLTSPFESRAPPAA